MQRRRIPVAATTNDAAAWSTGTRERDRLSAVWPWLVSSDVGTTTSNVAMFEVLRRESSIAHAHCLYVDTAVANLDAARELGMKTALFDTGVTAPGLCRVTRSSRPSSRIRTSTLRANGDADTVINFIGFIHENSDLPIERQISAHDKPRQNRQSRRPTQNTCQARPDRQTDRVTAGA